MTELTDTEKNTLLNYGYIPWLLDNGYVLDRDIEQLKVDLNLK